MPDENDIHFNTRIRKYGGSYYAKIPPTVVENLEIRDGLHAKMQVEEGQYGKYWSTWIPAFQKENGTEE